MLGEESTYKDEEKARTLTAEYKNLTSELAYLYDEWAKIEEQIEAAE